MGSLFTTPKEPEITSADVLLLLVTAYIVWRVVKLVFNAVKMVFTTIFYIFSPARPIRSKIKELCPVCYYGVKFADVGISEGELCANCEAYYEQHLQDQLSFQFAHPDL